MAILNFPDVPVESAGWRIQERNRSFTSDLTGSVQTAVLPGAKWVGSISVPRLPNKEIRDLKAFLLSLQGRAGSFYFVPLDLDQQGTRLGSGVVLGAGQTGALLSTSGWDASQSLLFAAGDYIEVNGELKMVTSDVSSDASGLASIPIAPILRKSPPDGAQILHEAPRAIMRLSSDDAGWDLSAAFFSASSFDIEEAF